MRRAEVLDWLAQRRPAPPDELRRHLEDVVVDRDAGMPEHLADEGRDLLARVIRIPVARRQGALDLLAADAFVTYAFEAQVEQDVRGLEALAERVGRAGGGA